MYKRWLFAHTASADVLFLYTRSVFFKLRKTWVVSCKLPSSYIRHANAEQAKSTL